MIIVDDRVGSAELLKYFPPGEAKLGRLEYADFSFSGKGPLDIPWLVGVERKSIRDLLACMASGRLAGRQLIGLLNGFNAVYLVVEGYFKADAKTGVLLTLGDGGWHTLHMGKRSFMLRDVWLYLNTMAVKTSVMWNTTQNPRETARFVSTLHRWWTFKEYAEHRSHLQPYQAPIAHIGRHSTVDRIALQLPGVGWERAQEVGRHFGSVAEMVTADKAKWLSVPGIGKKLADSIMKELRGQRS